MKHLVYLIITVFLVSSCGWNDFEEEDHLSTLSSLTSNSQVNLVTFVSGEPAIYSGIITQQVSGINNYLLDIERYDLSPILFDNSWSLFYRGILTNLNTLTSIAQENGMYKFEGIGNILMANALGIATDLWGDIPYTESIQFEETLEAPGYDSQELIYENIFILLNSGIELLTDNAEHYPGSEDIFFGGDVDSWIRYANFLKLRYTLHLSGLNGIEETTSLLDQAMFNSLGESLTLDYSTVNVINPRFQIITNDVRASQNLCNQLSANNDPRLPFYYKKNTDNEYVGSIAGAMNESASLLSDSIKSTHSKFILASYTEQLFIESEVYYRKDMLDESMLALKEAIKSSLYDYGVYDDQWYQTYIETIELSLETIMVEKHKALFLQTEVWTDWRRTGFPVLEASQGNVTGDVIPLRFSYPQSEFNYNPENVPTDLTVLDNVWWDI